MDSLIRLQSGPQRLANLGPSMPRRGVYFFFDETEPRTDSGYGPRLVRVGTHALTAGSSSTLRQRLTQHRGKLNGGGNHRGSIFRLLLGQALIVSGGPSCASWGVKGDLAKAGLALGKARADLLALEAPIEAAVSNYLLRLSFAFLAVDDEPSPNSLRSMIERHSIALLSNFERPALDPSTVNWLGHFSDRPLVAASGLWNQRHVSEEHNPAFLGALSHLIDQQARR
ncbi:hypothetical protein [Mesorhizobium sp. WSM3626]|uniref:hypothetical protein n=1 Tax=Mesorhizobium sp. WSM3626 TaxID=1040987 RepID=UPI0012EBC8E8|nr:hypothetical protein [Mesorhizobium sp. WSM3626]